ncbi:type I secretion system permease/ATPase [Agrobacterium larrymoorei]|uniref:Type I secretion system permease/ATPase n=1 Tax=Agrobacterium larrymoorei TaxID=160699 RepID=A0A4D7DZQ1_9HYPH|nr:type I secretion system permease/ATPase [Agrobacterium larrymoorei]QCJ00818.1 type I secretion system permease/ATPase [Agrobacterium larrymoorei]QYA10482.1 type I secretion system permease/ATPase [Agrobacterium larrymoorei]
MAFKFQSKEDLTREAFCRSRSGLVAIGLASALINVLYLTSSFFMLQVYDRVIPSHSIPSLIALGILAAALYAFQGAFELFRSRMLTRVSGVFDEVLGQRVFKVMLKTPIKTSGANDGLMVMRDFDQVRTFLSGTGPAAFFDLPWMPIYIGICFLFHPVVGIIAVCGALILIFITVLTNLTALAADRKVHDVWNQRNVLMGAALRNAEVVEAMGMSNDLARDWEDYNKRYRTLCRNSADSGSAYAIVSKIFRIALQSGVLAAGAVLVIENQASGGIIIASSILTSRALAPVEQVIASWRGFVLAQQSWKRIREIFDTIPEVSQPLTLPAPKETLSVQKLSTGPANAQQAIVSDISFTLHAGSAVGIIGPSASGKSSLSRALTGIWPIYRGSMRLDGAALDQWDESSRGQHIGYLPQGIELFTGTVSQNISRYRQDATPEAVVAAARAARVHDLILNLPQGYDTDIGLNGSLLSAGQRQRIALARALYGNPFLVILDEPNSNLDTEGEEALSTAISDVRARGGIVIVIAHRPSALVAVDHILMMKDGRAVAFGPKEDVLPKFLRRDSVMAAESRPVTLKVVGEGQE